MFKTFISAVALAFAMVVPALADTNAPATTPNGSITPPTVTCPDGSPTYEAGRETFLDQVYGVGGKLVAEKELEDKSFVIVIDTRSMSDYTGGEDFLYIVAFGPDHCFITSYFATQQAVQDGFGIVLASE